MARASHARALAAVQGSLLTSHHDLNIVKLEEYWFLPMGILV